MKAGNTEIDTKNGFMEFCNYAESRTQLAIFRNAKGERYLAISFIGDVFSEKTQAITDASEFRILRYIDHTWKDITAQVYPSKLKKGEWIELPKLGTIAKLHSGQRGEYLLK